MAKHPLQRRKIDIKQVCMAASKRFFIHNDIFVSLVSISYNFERVDLTRTPFNVNDFRKAISIKGKYRMAQERRFAILECNYLETTGEGEYRLPNHRWGTSLGVIPCPHSFSLSALSRRFRQEVLYEPVVIPKDYKSKLSWWAGQDKYRNSTPFPLFYIILMKHFLTEINQEKIPADF